MLNSKLKGGVILDKQYVANGIILEESKKHNFVVLDIKVMLDKEYVYTRQAGVYCLLFKSGGFVSVYIGETLDFLKRYQQHLLTTLKGKELIGVYFFTTYNNYFDKSLLFEIETLLLSKLSLKGGINLSNSKQLALGEVRFSGLVSMYAHLIYQYLIDKNIHLLNKVSADFEEQLEENYEYSPIYLKSCLEEYNRITGSNLKIWMEEDLKLLSGSSFELNKSNKLKVCEVLGFRSFEFLHSSNKSMVLVLLLNDVLVDEQNYKEIYGLFGI